MGFSPTFGARRFPKGERKELWCARRRKPPAAAGEIDAPTTARTVGLPPRGGQYFLSKRKKVPKKARGTATTGKRLLLPILAAGLAMSRAMNLDRFHLRLERARARLFPPSKWAGLFPSAAYRRSAPPQLAWGILTSCGLKGFLRLGCFATQKREACASPQWTAGRLTHCGAEYYRGSKGQRVFFCTLAFSAR